MRCTAEHRPRRCISTLLPFISWDELARLHNDLLRFSASLRGARIPDHVRTQLAQCQSSVDQASWEVATLSFLIPNQTRPRRSSVPSDGSEFVHESFKAAAKQMKKSTNPAVSGDGTSVLRNLAHVVRSYIEVNEVEKRALQDALSLRGDHHLRGSEEAEEGSEEAIAQLQELVQAFSRFKSSYSPEDLSDVVSRFEEAQPVILDALLRADPATTMEHRAQPATFCTAAFASEACDGKRQEILASLDSILSGPVASLAD